MNTNTEKDEKTCWACKRILVGGRKFGLCTDCLNKYGSPVAAIVIGGVLSSGSGWVWKNGGKVAKVAYNVIRNIKS